MNDMPPSLSRLLYRFDCPDPHTLGEYQLEVLDPEQRVEVARHASTCEECTAELSTLRAFLASDPAPSQTLADRVRRVVATLLAPSPTLGLAGMRGAADVESRQFRAEGVSITIAPGGEPGAIVGLVTGAVDLKDRPVRVANVTGLVDDLGNFELAGLTPGAYALELELPDRVVVVENLQID
jgi:hypothetical protein